MGRASAHCPRCLRQKLLDCTVALPYSWRADNVAPDPTSRTGELELPPGRYHIGAIQIGGPSDALLLGYFGHLRVAFHK